MMDKGSSTESQQGRILRRILRRSLLCHPALQSQVQSVKGITRAMKKGRGHKRVYKE